MILGHIGARKGSKGVPGKNVRPLCGKPLIDWSLDQLLENPRIDRIVVSTDDAELYEHAASRGCLEIGVRPAELATDHASKWHVWQHSLQAAEALLGPVDVFLDVDCTCPLREQEDIDRALDLFLSERPDMVMSCCEARKNPYFNLLEVNEEGSLRVSKSLGTTVVARQHAPTVYEHGLIYVLSPSYLKSASFLFDGRVLPSEMPPERCYDIDSELDFKVVELLMKEKLGI